MSEAKPAFTNPDIAEQILDRVQDIVNETESMPVRFQELTADAGELPRLMIAPITGNDTELPNYVSGEQIYPFPFALRFRQSVKDEQARLDAHALLSGITKNLLMQCQALDGYVVCRKPTATVPVCLGATNDFEDWEVTLRLMYKTTR